MVPGARRQVQTAAAFVQAEFHDAGLGREDPASMVAQQQQQQQPDPVAPVEQLLGAHGAVGPESGPGEGLTAAPLRPRSKDDTALERHAQLKLLMSGSELSGPICTAAALGAQLALFLAGVPFPVVASDWTVCTALLSTVDLL